VEPLRDSAAVGLDCGVKNHKFRACQRWPKAPPIREADGEGIDFPR
jgi:hypothetical protein